MIKNFLFIGIIVLTILGCEEDGNVYMELPYYNSADFTPEWIPQEHLDKIHTIGNFQLLNQYGEKISNKNVEGKIYVADFFFTFCPGICPKLTSNMATLQEEFKNDNQVLLLSHTVAPWKDSVSALMHYAEAQGVIKDKWHLLTGDTKEMYDLARKSYFADGEIGKQLDENDFLHTENFILIDQNGRIRGVYNGTLPFEVNQIIEDIRMLKQES